MNNNTSNIDKIVKEKFENFSPTPPEHIWKAIENGLDNAPVIPFYKNKRVIAASIFALVVIVSALVIFNPLSLNNLATDTQQNAAIVENTSVAFRNNESNSNPKVVDNITSINNNTHQTSEKASNLIEENTITENIIEPEIAQPESPKTNIALNEVVEINQVHNISEESNSFIPEIALSFNQGNNINPLELKKSTFVTDLENDYYFKPYPQKENGPMPVIEILHPEKTISYSHWKVGSYLSPELALSEFDSVEILNSYSFSIEPTYYINNNWFVRFGVGLSYVRDRGFAKINYKSNDYMGSYDDVYDITFDTIAGNITPIYHTKTVEVWDTVEHVLVNNVTNKYSYLQLPLLFGYHHKKQGSSFSWYILGGPAFNIKITESIDDPKPQEKDTEIISLQNNLPVRSGNYMQLWLGVGIEYKLNNRISLAVEPMYRYYFKSIYSKPYNSTASSGVTLRVGLVYTIK